MASVALYTPVWAYGLPMDLLPRPDVFTAHARLSPVSRLPVDAVDEWWSRWVVVPVPVASRTRMRQTGVGAWEFDAHAQPMDGGADVHAAQVGVNAAHVQALLAVLHGGEVLPPVRLIAVEGALWLMDGVHRTCAALAWAAERGAPVLLKAHVAGVAAGRACPCGWVGEPGALLEERGPHPHPLPATGSGFGL